MPNISSYVNENQYFDTVFDSLCLSVLESFLLSTGCLVPYYFKVKKPWSFRDQHSSGSYTSLTNLDLHMLDRRIWECNCFIVDMIPLKTTFCFMQARHKILIFLIKSLFPCSALVPVRQTLYIPLKTVFQNE